MRANRGVIEAAKSAWRKLRELTGGYKGRAIVVAREEILPQKTVTIDGHRVRVIVDSSLPERQNPDGSFSSDLYVVKSRDLPTLKEGATYGH